MEQAPKNSLSIPAAIVIAGALVAIGIVMSKAPAAPQQAANQAAQTVTVKPVTASDHILGNANAPITVVEYADLECPYCKMFEGTMSQIMSTYGTKGQVAWVYRHFTVHSLAPSEANAAECASAIGGNNAFWQYINTVFATTTSTNSLNPAVLPAIAKNLGLDTSKFNTCVSAATYLPLVQQETSDAEAAGGQGTPFSVMVLANPLSAAGQQAVGNYISQSGFGQYVSLGANGKTISLDGALPEANVAAIIDLVLKNQ